MTFTHRVLPDGEWSRVSLDGEMGQWMPMLRKGRDRIVVVEDVDGRIVGHAVLIQTVNAHAPEILPEHRGKAAVQRHLLQALHEAAAADGFACWVTSTVAMEEIASRLGERLPPTYAVKVA